MIHSIIIQIAQELYTETLDILSKMQKISSFTQSTKEAVDLSWWPPTFQPPAVATPPPGSTLAYVSHSQYLCLGLFFA